MPASQVVPALYPKQCLGAELADAPPTAAFHHIQFVSPEPSFGHAVAPTLSGAGEALSYMMFLK